MVKKTDCNIIAEPHERVLPDGIYIIKILDVTICSNKNSNGSHLKIAYDIAEPTESKNYFDFNYRNQDTENQKWNGFLYVPFKTDMQFEKTGRFSRFVNALEASNFAYQYNGNPTSMIGLYLGVYLENTEYRRSNNSICTIKTITDYFSTDDYWYEKFIETADIDDFYNDEYLEDEDSCELYYDSYPRGGC